MAPHAIDPLPTDQKPLFKSESTPIIHDQLSIYTGKPENNYGRGLLMFLFFLQGIPLGLVFGTIPMLLTKSTTENGSLNQSKVASIIEMGLFSLAGYPYSLKLLWAPLMDCLWIRSLPNRTLWIVPTQLLLGIMMFVISRSASCTSDGFLQPSTSAMTLALISAAIMILCACQDISLDAWSAETPASVDPVMASMYQSMSMNIGYFCSTTLLQALSSTSFCNALQKRPSSRVVLDLHTFTLLCSIVYVASAISMSRLLVARKPHQESSSQSNVTFLKRNNHSTCSSGDLSEMSSSVSAVGSINSLHSSLEICSESKDSLLDDSIVAPTRQVKITGPPTIASAYVVMWHLLIKVEVYLLAIILLAARIGSAAMDTMVVTELLRRRVSTRTLEFTAVYDFALQILLGFIISIMRLSPKHSLRLWLISLNLRIALAVFFTPLLLLLGICSKNLGFAAVIIFTTASSMANVAMFLGMNVFFMEIIDQRCASTYSALINLFANFGALWPRFFVHSALNRLYSWISNDNAFHLVNLGCILLGLLVTHRFINPIANRLASLSKSVWHLS